MNLDDIVYEAIADGLARLAQPDFGAIDPARVELAVVRAFTMDGPRPGWLDDLRRRVVVASDGATALEDADRDKFPALMKDPSAVYQRVVGPGQSRLAVIGPFTPCVQYADNTSERT